MTARKKGPPRWRAPFLRALRETRSVRQATWRVGVDHSSAYNLRKRDPEFAAEWAEALAAEDGGSKLRVGEERADRDRRYSPRAEEDYVVRRSKRCGPQVVRAGPGRWSRKIKSQFLGELAAHSNVSRAAAAIGFSTTAVYTRRLNDPEFAAEWAAARECGRERIDLFLIEAANRALDPDAFEVSDDLPKVTVAEAIQILKLHDVADRREARKAAEAPVAPRLLIPIEEVREEVLRRVEAVRRAMERGEWDEEDDDCNDQDNEDKAEEDGEDRRNEDGEGVDRAAGEAVAGRGAARGGKDEG